MSSNTDIQTPTLLERTRDSLYFDRGDLARKLRNKLINDHFVVLLGNQGAGKSSLVDIALRNAVESGDVSGDNGKHWKMIWTNPNANPIRHLALDLAKPGALKPKGAAQINDYAHIETQLREGNHGLIKVYEDALEVSEEPFNLLIAINQEQDLYRYQDFIPQVAESGDDIRFLDLVMTTAREKLPIYLVFITDTENLGHFSRYRGMPEAINNFRFNVPFLSAVEYQDQLKALASTDEEREYVSRLLQGLAKLEQNEDRQTLYKLRHCLNYTQLLFSELSEEEQKAPGALLKAFDQISADDHYIDENGELKARPRSGMEEALNHHLERLFNSLPETEGKEGRLQNIAEFLFKALTFEGPDAVPLPQPLFAKDLLKLCNRLPKDKVKMADLQAIIDHFNSVHANEVTKHVFLDVLGSEEEKLTEHSIVDINNPAILHSWQRMQYWAEEELLHANIYKAIIRDAKTYSTQVAMDKARGKTNTNGEATAETTAAKNSSFEQLFEQFKQLPNQWLNKGEEEKEAPKTEDLLYTGASLSGAVAWRDTGQPNETWAERYLPPEPAGFSLEFLKEVRTKFSIPATNPVTQLWVARWFVDTSERATQLALERERAEQIRKEKRTRRINRIITALGTLSVITMIFAVRACDTAKAAKENLDLVDFVEMLQYYDVLNTETNNDFLDLYALHQEVVEIDSIQSYEKVLQYFHQRDSIGRDTNQNHIDLLPFSNRKEERDRSIYALSLIGDLFSYLKEGEEPTGLYAKPIIGDILNFLKKDKETGFTPDQAPSLEQLWRYSKEHLYDAERREAYGLGIQQPYLYYALEAHIDILANGKEHRFGNKELNWPVSTIVPAQIRALASSPVDADKMAFGDANGQVVVLLENPNKDDPPEGYVMPKPVPTLVNTMTFYQEPDGEEVIFVGTAAGRIYSYGGLEYPRGEHPQKLLTEMSNSVYHLEHFRIDGVPLLYIGYATGIAVMDLRTKRLLLKQEIVETYDFPRTNDFAVDPITQTLLVGGKDGALVFRLERTRRGFRLNRPHKIVTPDIVVTSIGLKRYPADNEAYLAMGTETGELLLSKDFPSWLGLLDKDENAFGLGFRTYTGHRTSVLALDFAPDRPQLATVGAGLRFWDLADVDSRWRHIDIQQGTVGFQKIAYLNANELVGADLLNIKVWRTGVLPQWEYLDRLTSYHEQGNAPQ